MSDSRETVGPAWDRRYREHGWSAVPDENLVDLVAALLPGRALDLGCGTGRNALWLARVGWAVTGVDASRVGLDMALEQAAREGVDLDVVRADLLDYEPARGAYDLVVAANIHLEVSDRDVFFARAAAAVAPGGHLYLVGHHVDALGVAGPPVRERLYEESLFRDHFDDLVVHRLERLEMRAPGGDLEDVAVLLWATRPLAQAPR